MPDEPESFIAFDYCGWNESTGRFTVMPTGETLLYRSEKTLLEFLAKFPGLPVYSCPGRYTTVGTKPLGTTEEICERVRGKSAVA